MIPTSLYYIQSTIGLNGACLLVAATQVHVVLLDLQPVRICIFEKLAEYEGYAKHQHLLWMVNTYRNSKRKQSRKQPQLVLKLNQNLLQIFLSMFKVHVVIDKGDSLSEEKKIKYVGKQLPITKKKACVQINILATIRQPLSLIAIKPALSSLRVISRRPT